MKELFEFLWSKKKYWIIPVAFVLILLGYIIIYAASSALSPFIYTLF